MPLGKYFFYVFPSGKNENSRMAQNWKFSHGIDTVVLPFDSPHQEFISYPRHARGNPQMKCQKCQSDNPDRKTFCGDCGTQLGLPQEAPAFTKTLQAPFPQFGPGTTLAHRYEIMGELGKGGMGEVYLAEDSNLKRQVAIKVLPHPFALDEERLARFEREARLLASLNRQAQRRSCKLRPRSINQRLV